MKVPKPFFKQMFKQSLSTPLAAYFKAEGRMGRGRFIVLNLGVIVFSAGLQLFLIYQTEKAGLAATSPAMLVVPLWAAALVLWGNVLLLPAIALRARDGGWPTWLFTGLFAAHLVFATLHSFLGVMVLPAGAAFVLQGLAILGVLALMVKPPFNIKA